MAAGDKSDALLDRVRARIGEPSKSGILDDVLWQFVNLAQLDLIERLDDNDIPELTEIASGSLTNSRVGLPADFLRPRLLLIGSNEIPARRWPVHELDALEGSTVYVPSLTDPYYYIWRDATDDAIRLKVEVGNASSTDAYKLFYTKLPAAIDTDTDPDFGDHLHDLLVDYTVSLCRMVAKEYGERDRVRRQYFDQVATFSSRGVGNEPFDDVPGDLT